MLVGLVKSSNMSKEAWIYELVAAEHRQAPLYYLENGSVVFTETYLSKRGECCGNKCRHCPYTPQHQKGTNNLNNSYESRS